MILPYCAQAPTVVSSTPKHLLMDGDNGSTWVDDDGWYLDIPASDLLSAATTTNVDSIEVDIGQDEDVRLVAWDLVLDSQDQWGIDLYEDGAWMKDADGYLHFLWDIAGGTTDAILGRGESQVNSMRISRNVDGNHAGSILWGCNFKIDVLNGSDSKLPTSIWFDNFGYYATEATLTSAFTEGFGKRTERDAKWHTTFPTHTKFRLIGADGISLGMDPQSTVNGGFCVYRRKILRVDVPTGNTL